MINILTQKAATFFFFKHTDTRFPCVRYSDNSPWTMGKMILCLNSVHFFHSIIIIEFQVADYGGALIVCQGNFNRKFYQVSEARKLSGFVAHDLIGHLWR